MIQDKEFCIECRQYVNYEIRKVWKKYNIKEKDYNMKVTVAFCKNCGKEINIPGIMDTRTKEIEKQYIEQSKGDKQ